MADVFPDHPHDDSPSFAIRAFKGDSFAEPVCEPSFVNFASGDSEHRINRLLDVRRVTIPGSIVEIDENDEASPSRSFVAVG